MSAKRVAVVVVFAILCALKFNADEASKRTNRAVRPAPLLNRSPKTILVEPERTNTRIIIIVSWVCFLFVPAPTLIVIVLYGIVCVCARFMRTFLMHVGD